MFHPGAWQPLPRVTQANVLSGRAASRPAVIQPVQSRQVSISTHLRSSKKIPWLVATRIGMGGKENNWLRHRPLFPRRRKRQLVKGTEEEENQSRAHAPRVPSRGLGLGLGRQERSGGARVSEVPVPPRSLRSKEAAPVNHKIK